MKKSVRNSLIALLIIVILLLIFRERTPFGSRNSSFTLDDKNQVTRIELSQEKNRLVLEKKGEGWFVNGRYEARKSSINFIMKILREVKIKSPVSPEKFESEIIKNGIKPVSVRVYGNSRLLKSYMVFKTPSNIYGNIMKMRERSKPFIVHIPGYEDDIGSSFSLNELYWQPFTVFNFLPSEIASVSLQNFADTSDSFTIIHENHNVSLYNGSELSGWDTSLVRRYLTYYTWIPFEKWAFDMPAEEKNRIESGLPFTRITVTDQAGITTVLSLWEKQIDSNGMKIKDTDRLWGKTGSTDELFILRYFDVDPILKKRSYFFQ